jgi:hypothetical protein
VIEWEDESPYPEVRAAGPFRLPVSSVAARLTRTVSNTDDMDMPVNTIRAFTIGILWAVIIPGLNQVNPSPPSRAHAQS